ncbi:MAG: GLPGLI family protein [Spirosomataceae bacterium]
MNSMYNIPLTFALLFLATALFGQNYKVAYRLHYFENPVERTGNQQEDFYLYTDQDHSEFVSVLKMKSDSVVKFDKNDVGSKFATLKAMPKTKFEFFLTKQYNTKTVLFAQNFSANIAYQQVGTTYAWEVMDTTKTVNGFTCRKATLQHLGNTYEAWFTDEVPVFDGPYFFHGLPGLILEVTCPGRGYRFEFLGIENALPLMEYGKKKLFALSDNREKFLALYDDWEKNEVRNSFKTGRISLVSPTNDQEEEAFINRMQAETDAKRSKFKLEIF